MGKTARARNRRCGPGGIGVTVEAVRSSRRRVTVPQPEEVASVVQPEVVPVQPDVEPVQPEVVPVQPEVVPVVAVPPEVPVVQPEVVPFQPEVVPVVAVPPEVPVGHDPLGMGVNGNNLLDNSIFDINAPAVVSSVHSDVGVHVSAAITGKLIVGQYVDLALLLDAQNGSEQKRRLELSQCGESVLKPCQTNKNITNIETWFDAFLIYASIFLAVHPYRNQEILKYMHVIRTAAKRHHGLGWLKDQH